MDPAELLSNRLREYGYSIPGDLLKHIMAEAGLSLTGGSRHIAESHLDRHRKLDLNPRSPA